MRTEVELLQAIEIFKMRLENAPEMAKAHHLGLIEGLQWALGMSAAEIATKWDTE
jgi:hypothetical protein